MTLIHHLFNMKEKEIKLITDLYKHFQPQTDVTDELINSCYNQYGSIRGILMNLILKFQPNVDVTDEYLDKKLSDYGLLITEENKIIVEKDVVKIEEVTPVAEESPATEDIPKEENSKVEAVEKEETLQEPTKVTHKETASSDSKKKSKTSLIVTLLIVGTIGLIGFLNQDMLLGYFNNTAATDVANSSSVIVPSSSKSIPLNTAGESKTFAGSRSST